MKMKMFIFILFAAISAAKASALRELAGCDDGWVHFKNHCYNFIRGTIHFDGAKSVCTLKGASLVSLWKPDEIDFVTGRLKQVTKDDSVSAWVGTIPTKNHKWMWMDGSFFDLGDKDTPPGDAGMCGSMTPKGDLIFVDCDNTRPAFVCKKPLEMLYAPSDMNITDDLVRLDADQSATIFERIWPPELDTISFDETKQHHLATVDVTYETDCAYRCYTVDDCHAFIVTCKAARKCNTFSCTLLSAVKQTI